MKPLCIDLFCGLGGWTDGFLAEGWDCIGFDITRHDYGKGGYPGQLVLQDILSLHGSQFRNADCIVASPPCQEFSYMAMPWSRAKQIKDALESDNEGFPEGYRGSRTIKELTALFDACFRIQREACEASSRYIPMVVENVKGAQPWVGKARANFGSFYLWGDVDSVGGRIVVGRPQFGVTVKAARRGSKVLARANIRDGHTHTRHLTNQREHEGLERNEGVKQSGLSGAAWFNQGAAAVSSGSSTRAAASAEIAKIPLPLSRHIARCFRPSTERAA